VDRIKQIIIIRRDLKNVDGQKVRSGKIIAQACHASIAFLTNFIRKNPESNIGQKLSSVQKEWIDGSFFKICLAVDSEKELLDILEKSRNIGLDAHLITDKGHTEFGGISTNTCLALGPDYSSRLDPITGHLKLF